METMITLPMAAVVMNVLGIPGLVFIIWWYDHKAMLRQNETAQASISKILAQYKEDVTEMKRLYENNVTLCKNYEETLRRQEKMLSELFSVISYNTQVMTQLKDVITNNQFCPNNRRQIA